MIAVDTNILVHAHRIDSEWNGVAHATVTALAEGRAAWAIPWPCLYEFYSVVTNPRLFKPPSTLAEAIAQIDIWMESSSLTILAETPVAWRVLRDLIRSTKIVGGQIHDAKIAALCMQQGVNELWSADKDFTRFPLRVVNPLIATRANEPRARYGVSAAAKQKTAARPRAR